MKFVNIVIIATLSLSILSSCNIKSPTTSDILNKDEKIIFGNNDGVYELKQSSLIAEKIKLPDNFNNFINLAWSNDGKRILYSLNEDNVTNTYIMNSDGSNKIKLLNMPAIDAFPRWSNDGTKIVFSSVGTFSSLYTINSDGSNLKRLTSDNFNYVKPSFSPDGTKIAFSSDKDTRKENELTATKYLYVMNSDGSNLKRLITDEKINGGTPDWVSNTKIIYTNGYNLFSINADGSNPIQITNNGSLNPGIPGQYYELPRISQDTKKVVFTSNRDGNREVYIRNISDGNEIRVTKNTIDDWFPIWIN